MTAAKVSAGHKSEHSAKNGTIADNGDSRPNGTGCTQSQSSLPLEKDLVLWKSPIQTTVYFIYELIYQLQRGISWLRRSIKSVLLTVIVLAIIYFLRDIEGAHRKIFQVVEKKLLWCLYWIGLGILSSVGLGTGLHTFLLYLGPHIAAVTVAAHECKSLNFPEPPYPDEIICPDDGTTMDVSLWAIIAKVRLEACMWGLGTAIGELPPYFMARAARLSGEELEQIMEDDPHAYWSSMIKKVVEKAGFLGILVCASIPNPLFDLAGITCGHFLVPFWTFFGATAIGKAVIKMLIQKIFVIIAFSEHHFESLIDLASSIPHVGEKLSTWTRGFLTSQKASLHRKPGAHIPKEPHLIAKLFEGLVFMMLLYFVVSIIQSFAQNCVRRLNETKKTHKN